MTVFQCHMSVCVCAMLQGDVVTVERLLETGAAVSAKDHAGWTPLVRLSRHRPNLRDMSLCLPYSTYSAFSALGKFVKFLQNIL